MKAAVLTETGAVPQFADFPDPSPGPGEVVVEVTAAGVHHLDLAKAAGAFGTPAQMPCVLGSDGVGRTADGRRVFFPGVVPPHGSWAQLTLVPEADLLDLDDGVDDISAAALGNTGLAAYLALTWRAALRPGESVLVLGAAGALGSIAVQVARILGAGPIVAADRDSGRLAQAVERGADAAVTVDSGADLVAALREAAGPRGFDVIVDPVWGNPALAAMHAAAHGARHVQIGQSAGATIELPAGLVRGARLDVLGFAHLHAPAEVRRAAYLALTRHAAAGDIVVDARPVPLGDCAHAWEEQRHGARAKLVLAP